jgi:hypothetical protein
VDLGVEHGEALPGRGDPVGVGAGDPFDQPFEAQPSQVVAHPVAGVALRAEQRGHQGTQALVGDRSGDGVDGQGQRAGQGHDPRVAEPQGRGPLPAVLDGGVCDPLKGWARKDAALADTLSLQQAAVGVTALGLELVEVFQTA